MPDRTCSVDGCEAPLECRGYCSKHYQRWRRYGDPLKLRERPTCSMEGCEETAKGRGLCPKHYVHWRSHRTEGERCAASDCGLVVYAQGWCRKHYDRVKRHGDPGIVLAGGKPGGSMKGVLGPDHPQWRGDDAGYGAAHIRMTRLHGRAVEHTCAHCGNPAHDWAFDGPRAAADVQFDARGYPYSFNPAYYTPLCISCHRRQNPGRPKSRKTHCPQGHPYDEANTYRPPSRNERQCRTCRGMRQKLKEVG